MRARAKTITQTSCAPLRFLERHQQIAGFEKDIALYREALLVLADAGSVAGQAKLTVARERLEQRLRQVMVRTERLASTRGESEIVPFWGQDDLVRYLTERVPAAELERIMTEARIQLAPS